MVWSDRLAVIKSDLQAAIEAAESDRSVDSNLIEALALLNLAIEAFSGGGGGGSTDLSSVENRLGSLTGGAADPSTLASSPTTSTTILQALIALVIRSGKNGDAASATGSQSAQLRQLISLVQGTLAISASTLPLPAGAASETTLGSVLTALQGNINFSDTIWTDDSGAYFIRQTRQNQDTNTITVSYLNLDGTAYTVGSNPRPADRDRDVELRTFTFRSNNSGTGYSSGQIIVRTDVLDVSASTASILSTAWFNASTNATIAAPNTAHLEVPPDSALTDAQLRAQVVAVADAAGNTLIGSVTETPPASDTASSGLNGRIQRLLQRFTTLFSLLPASLGQKAKAASLAVTLANDEDILARLGTVTETAPATDTASSGLNGRSQRIAQRLTTLLSLLPASLGIKNAAGSLSVAPASDGIFQIQGRSPGTFAGANSTTNSGANTWKEVFVAGTNLEVFIQNQSTTAILQVGIGANGSEVLVADLSPQTTTPVGAGGAWGYTAPQAVPGERIAVRSPGSSQPYIAFRRT